MGMFGSALASKLKLKVNKINVEAKDVCSFEFISPHGDDLPPFTAGAHIDVHIKNGLMRQYSLCNDPRERHRYVIAVQREENGKGGSKTMHDALKEGAILEIGIPRNNLPLEQNASKHILLAGGIGVTPMLSMALQLKTLGADFEMHYCTRSRERTAFFDLLSSLEFKNKVRFHFDEGSPGSRLDLKALLAKRPEGAHLYMCGPPGFMRAIEEAAEGIWPSETIHMEFFSAVPSALADNNKAFEIILAKSGQTYTIPADKSIIDVLGENGIQVQVSCEQGICGSCITPVLEGEPEHRDKVLSAREKGANNLCTLCVSRAKSERLVLDM